MFDFPSKTFALRKKIEYILEKDEKLLKHSLIVTIALVIGMLINYFYQLLVGRMLGPSNYGVFGALVSITYIISVFRGVVNTSITKFSSEFYERKEFGKIKYMLIDYSLKLLIIGILGFFVFVFLKDVILSQLQISSLSSYILVCLTIPLSLIFSLYSGVMRGMQKFNEYSLLSIAQPIIKFLVGTVLMLLGFSVFGAIFGFVSSSFIACVLSIILLKHVFKHKKEKISSLNILKYSLPVLLSSLCITLLINLDMLLVKSFFSSIEAGFYYAASTLTKVIFWVTGSLVFVMFPKISGKANLSIKENLNRARKILKSAIAYASLFSILVMLAIVIVGDLITTFTFGESYAEASSLMLPFAFAMCFVSLNQIMINYSLAINRRVFGYITLLIIFTGIEAIGIMLFHETLLQVIYSIILSNLLLFLSFIVLELLKSPNIMKFLEIK